MLHGSHAGSHAMSYENCKEIRQLIYDSHSFKISMSTKKHKSNYGGHRPHATGEKFGGEGGGVGGKYKKACVQ